jgi:hypothetical protein
MADNVEPMLPEKAFQAGIANIHLMKLAFGIDVFAEAGEEIVNNHHFMPVGEIRVRDMRTDETGSAGNQNFSHGTPSVF